MMKNIILLMMLFLRSIFAETVEIGVPYIEKGSGQIDSAVVAPSGKRFYTLKNGLITHWQLEPLKKLYSFETGIKDGLCTSEKPSSYPSLCNINVTLNEKKLILRTQERLFLFDLERKSLIDEVKHKSLYGAIDGKNYITFDTNNWNVKDNFFSSWEVNKYIKKIETRQYEIALQTIDKNSNVDELHLDSSFKSVLIVADTILTFVNDDISLYNKRTFEILDRASKHISNAPYLNFNHKFIDYYKSLERFDLNRTIRTNDTNIKPFRFKLNTYWPLVSISKDLALHRTKDSNYLFLIPDKTLKKRKFNYAVTFYQYSNSKAVLIVTNGAKKNRNYFERTLNMKNKLTMKTPSGNVVPINDATFQKYNTIIKF